MSPDINQGPHHPAGHQGINDVEQRHLRPESVPAAVKAVIVRLTGRPQRVLASIVLRADHCAIQSAPKHFLQRGAHTCRIDTYNIEFIPPCLPSCETNAAEVEAWDFGLCVGAGLVNANEADAYAGEDLIAGGVVEPYPRSGWDQSRATVNAIGDDTEGFG